MEIFKQLNKLGYKHYVDLTIEELDKLPIDNIERRIECSLIIDWFREKHKIDIYPEPTYSLTEYSKNFNFGWAANDPLVVSDAQAMFAYYSKEQDVDKLNKNNIVS